MRFIYQKKNFYIEFILRSVKLLLILQNYEDRLHTLFLTTYKAIRKIKIFNLLKSFDLLKIFIFRCYNIVPKTVTIRITKFFICPYLKCKTKVGGNYSFFLSPVILKINISRMVDVNF